MNPISIQILTISVCLGILDVLFDILIQDIDAKLLVIAGR